MPPRRAASGPGQGAPRIRRGNQCVAHRKHQTDGANSCDVSKVVASTRSSGEYAEQVRQHRRGDGARQTDVEAYATLPIINGMHKSGMQFEIISKVIASTRSSKPKTTRMTNAMKMGFESSIPASASPECDGCSQIKASEGLVT